MKEWILSWIISLIISLLPLQNLSEKSSERQIPKLKKRWEWNYIKKFKRRIKKLRFSKLVEPFFGSKQRVTITPMPLRYDNFAFDPTEKNKESSK